MIKVAVLFRKDGDQLAVEQVPWWTDIWEWTAYRFCPCCGVAGWLSRWERVEMFFYWLWTQMLKVVHDRTKTLYKAPILSGCAATRAIFDEYATCWRDDCEYCWEDREDVYSERAQ